MKPRGNGTYLRDWDCFTCGKPLAADDTTCTNREKKHGVVKVTNIGDSGDVSWFHVECAERWAKG